MNIISCINMYNFTYADISFVKDCESILRFRSTTWEHALSLEQQQPALEINRVRHLQNGATSSYYMQTHTQLTNQWQNQPICSVWMSLSILLWKMILYFSVWTSHFSILNFCLHHMLENHCERPSKYALVRKQGSTDDVRQWPSYRLWQNKLNAGFWLGLSKMDKCFNEAPTSDQFLNEKRFWFAND